MHELVVGFDAGTAIGTAKPAVEAVQAVAPPSQPFDFVLWLVIVLALSMLFLTEFVRALPWTEKVRNAKPLGCDACMVGWQAIAALIYFGHVVFPLWAVLHVLPAAGVALLGLGIRGWLKEKSETLRPPP